LKETQKEEIPEQLRTEGRAQNHEGISQHLQEKSYQDVDENMDESRRLWSSLNKTKSMTMVQVMSVKMQRIDRRGRRRKK